jgi:hypothetical protein
MGRAEGERNGAIKKSRAEGAERATKMCIKPGRRMSVPGCSPNGGDGNSNTRT